MLDLTYLIFIKAPLPACNNAAPQQFPLFQSRVSRAWRAVRLFFIASAQMDPFTVHLQLPEAIALPGVSGFYRLQHKDNPSANFFPASADALQRELRSTFHNQGGLQR